VYAALDVLAADASMVGLWGAARMISELHLRGGRQGPVNHLSANAAPQRPLHCDAFTWSFLPGGLLLGAVAAVIRGNFAACPAQEFLLVLVPRT
jgi:hypothetical protein